MPKFSNQAISLYLAISHVGGMCPLPTLTNALLFILVMTTTVLAIILRAFNFCVPDD